RFVVMTGSPGVMTSTDGIMWTPSVIADGSESFSSVSYVNNQFIALGVNMVALSADGITWTLHETTLNAESGGVVTYAPDKGLNNEGLYIAVSSLSMSQEQEPVSFIATSPDGEVWTELDSAE